MSPAPMFATLIIVLLVGLRSVSPVAAHQLTFSRLDVTLSPQATEVEVKLPVVTLVHELDEIGGSPLPPGTTSVDLAAVPLDAAVAAALATLLEERLVLTSGGEALVLDVSNVAGGVEDVTITATTPTATDALGGTADFFPSDPMHKVFLTVWREGALAGQWPLDAASPAFAIEAPGRSLGAVVAEFVREGIRHIFIGPDHILFILALILLGGALWAQVKIVTAFTIAHSVTLTLATLEVVTLPPRLVESVIALSIVVVGLHDLWRIRWSRPGATAMPDRDLRPFFALGFGLVHGFGFANVLQELALPREALAWALGAFNLGVELGQVVIVLVAAPLLWALGQAAPPIVARATLAGLAGAVVAVGGLWFWERALMGA